jgi:hypothetical protein
MAGKEPQTTTIEVPPLSIRAAVGSVDAEKRTVELIFSTGAAVERMDYWTGKRYIEKLSMKPEHVRLDRMNSGAPLLDAHSAWSIGDVFGTIEPDSARIEKGKGLATVRFSKRDAVEPVWQDVRDGIIRSVSVGYMVHKFEETTPKDGGIPTRLATDWEPYEVSLVPMPADTGARVRGEERRDTNPCVLITRAGDTPMEAERQPSEFVVESNPLNPEAPAPERRAAAAEQVPNDRDLGATAERDRIQGILMGVRNARLPMSVADKLIVDGTPLVRAQSHILEEMGRREKIDQGPKDGPADVRINGDDPLVHVRSGIENAILHRVAPHFFKLDDQGRQYRGMTMLDVAGTFLRAAGVRTTGMNRLEVAGLALQRRGGYHTTSDFSTLLEGVVTKTLRRAYEEAPQTFKAIAQQTTLPNFLPVKRVTIGDAPALLEVKEHGEFTRGTIGEGRETFQLATYGRVFAITRQAIVNDDTDSFSRVPMLFGRSARTLESDLVWAEITENATMEDGNALFSAAHGNIDATGAVISVESLGAARAALRTQTGVDGQRLNISARYLIVPAALETVADQFVTAVQSQQAGQVNPFAGRLTVIAEPRLDADSPIAWYLAADPSQIAGLEYAYLEGESGPSIETRMGFDIDGMETKARLDFAAKAVDYRGFYKNVGAELT